MITNIYGGGSGSYANTGSSFGTVKYLKHEDLDRAKEGKEVEPFFNQTEDKVSMKKVVQDIDNNKKGLKKTDAKFYVLEVNPSQLELSKMGNTEAERSAAMKDFIRSEVMPNYAANFKKDLDVNDIKYYGKIHHSRGKDGELQTHAHIIVSRKTMDMKKSISPKTNHRNTKQGVVKGGFDRKAFINNVEKSFDKKFNRDRGRHYMQSFEYLNARKQKDAVKQEAIKKEWYQNREKKKEQNNSKNRGLSM